MSIQQDRGLKGSLWRNILKVTWGEKINKMILEGWCKRVEEGENTKFWIIAESGPTSIGGVLCGNKGKILAKLAAFLGVKDSNESEFLAIVIALKFSLDTE